MILLSWFRKNGALALLTFFLALPAQAAFTDNGDGTVNDTVTGLMWDRCSYGQNNDATCSGSANTYTWAQALGVAVTANAANHKGQRDWRLPNKNELESLVDLTRSNPSIDTTAFPSTVTRGYWSSTNYFAYRPDLAWGVHFGVGFPAAGGRSSDLLYVRLVRSGQLFDSFDAQGETEGATPIPTLSEWALILLAGLMGLFGAGVMRRHKVSGL